MPRKKFVAGVIAIALMLYIGFYSLIYKVEEERATDGIRRDAISEDNKGVRTIVTSYYIDHAPPMVRMWVSDWCYNREYITKVIFYGFYPLQRLDSAIHNFIFQLK